MDEVGGKVTDHLWRADDGAEDGADGAGGEVLQEAELGGGEHGRQIGLDAVDDEEVQRAVGHRKKKLGVGAAQQSLGGQFGHDAGGGGALELEHRLVGVGGMHQRLGHGSVHMGAIQILVWASQNLEGLVGRDSCCQCNNLPAQCPCSHGLQIRQLVRCATTQR